MKIGKLQIIISAIALAAALFAILIFAGVIPGFGGLGANQFSKISMWGPLDKNIVNRYTGELKRNPTNIEIVYTQKDPETIENDFVDALANGTGPDIILLPSNLIYKHKNKLAKVPENIMSARNFIDIFADGTEILLDTDGITGLPFMIDPLVLYWNRDIFRNESIPAPPKTWDEFMMISQKLTKLDQSGKILRSGAALGVESNINNLKDIISLLVLETGAPIVENRTFRINFSPDAGNSGPDGMEYALRFYSAFSNPQKFSYSWTRAMPEAKDVFTRDSLAMYFGFGSEMPLLKEANPHLNFDVYPVPQILNGKLKLTSGKFLFLGVAKQTRSPEASFKAVQILSGKNFLEEISKDFYLAPARRDLLDYSGKDPALETIYGESIRFKTWVDADPEKTLDIFRQMVKSVYIGEKTENQASRDAKAQLELLYR
ncbi:extracellular solute-binding protein [Candidatus Giovannonibacteria bacterium]|nr:extracellular solute-binding protein [Candidatus Giovannonibacteria bacterium]